MMEKFTSWAKRRGFIFQSSEIYGGTGAAYDYGPLGVLVKNNLKKLWWQDVVQKRADMVGLDAAILMKRQVWQASGHEKGFHDPLVECKTCHERFRADDQKSIEEHQTKTKHKTFTEAKQFNLMFKTFMGPVESLDSARGKDEAALTYLRPETAQGIFVNFKNVLNTSRTKIPFGIAQIGKAFRNEITPGNFTYRTREFEQMEIEYFVPPQEANKWYQYWVKEREKWYQTYGLKKENLRLREHKKDELAHYAKEATDVEYNFPFGWSELEGVANRQDYDLKQHQEFSKKELEYFDEETDKHYLPYVIEPSGGVDRALLAFLVDAFEEIPNVKIQNPNEVQNPKSKNNEDEKERQTGEIVLHLHSALSPIKVAVFPLVNKDKLPEIAKEIYQELKENWFVQYDDTGSIGRRYRRQDEIGTPYCVTVDFESLKKQDVTVRDRDTMKQERVKIEELKDYLEKKLD